MNITKWDFLFFLLTGGLLLLNHFDEIDVLTKLPFVFLFLTYTIVRWIGSTTKSAR